MRQRWSVDVQLRLETLMQVRAPENKMLKGAIRPEKDVRCRARLFNDSQNISGGLLNRS